MNTHDNSTSGSELSGPRLFLEWTASTAAIGLTAFGIYTAEEHLQGAELPGLIVPLAVVFLIAPVVGALYGLFLRVKYPFRDHARIFLMMTFMILGGILGRATGGVEMRLLGAICGVLFGAAVWWLIWRPSPDTSSTS